MITIGEIYGDIRNLGLEGRFALDVASVCTGIRSMGLLHVPVENSPAVSRWLGQSGFRVEAERRLSRVRDAFTRESILNEFDRLSDRAEVWCEIWFARREVDPLSGEKLFANPGRWLEYPDCCVDFMQGKGTLASHYNSYLRSDGSLRYWEINRLASLFSKELLMLEFFPCSLSCGSALRFAKTLLPLAQDVLPDVEFSSGYSAARMPMFLWSDYLVAFPRWECVNGQLRLEAEYAQKVQLKEIGYSEDSFSALPQMLGFNHLVDDLRVTESSIAVDLIIADEEAQKFSCAVR